MKGVIWVAIVMKLTPGDGEIVEGVFDDDEIREEGAENVV